jgi:hypothetical protein
MTIPRNEFICSDVLDGLSRLPAESVHCVVTSPPYWALRDYGVAGQLGLEASVEDYLAAMVNVFRAIKRVLRHDGTLWLNMGDCYHSPDFGGYTETRGANRGNDASNFQAPNRGGQTMKTRPILFFAPMVRAILAGKKTQTRRIVKPQPMERETTFWSDISRPGHWFGVDETTKTRGTSFKCPYGQPGDRLWVKETWRPGMHPESFCAVQYRADNHWMKPKGLDDNTGYKFADWCDRKPEKWTPSIFMPRWASRITLDITGVRVERLQDITREDAYAEGIETQGGDDETRNRTTVENYARLWDSINGAPKPIRDSNKHVTGFRCYPWSLESFMLKFGPSKNLTVHGTKWRGQPLIIVANPWVWVISFRRAQA